MNTIFKIVCTAAIAASAASAAQAETGEQRQIAVRTADLDLSAPQGQATLDRRINTAVKQVCDLNSSIRDMNQRRHAQQCAATARGQAMAQVRRLSSPSLVANTKD